MIALLTKKKQQSSIRIVWTVDVVYQLEEEILCSFEILCSVCIPSILQELVFNPDAIRL